MLQPVRTRWRKAHKGRIHGTATRASSINYGAYALKALQPERITGKQIEAARVALTRHMKRQGRVWTRVFPNVPVSKKPIEVRMGKGKGNPEFFACRVKPGRILFEVDGVSEQIAKEALYKASAKLPIGNLADALYRASLAICSETPSTSNKILPGLTLHAKNSGFPLPFPILTSIGFFETGTLGKTLVQTLPCLFICLVNATLAASICFPVIRSGCKALSAYAP